MSSYLYSGDHITLYCNFLPFCLFIYLLLLFSLFFIKSGVQRLLLILHSDITPGGIWRPHDWQGYNPNLSHVRQMPYLLNYMSRP